MVALAIVVVATAGCDPAPCEPPYEPAAGTTQPENENWPVNGMDWRPSPAPPVLDTDGDGVEDQVVDGASASGALTIHRGSGDLVLTGADPADRVTAPPDEPSVGDVHGDGRSDVIVRVEAASGGLTHYLVPGATPDGTHEVPSVGVLIAGWQPISAPYVPGDVDADGRDDLVLTARRVLPDGSAFEDTLLHSGARLATIPAGGTSAEPVSLGGRFMNLLRVDDATNAVAVGTSDEESFNVVVWVAGATIEFTTAGQIVYPSFTYWPSARLGVAPDGRPWLKLEAYGRTAGGAWAWRIDDFCRTGS